jgi:iron complex transport system permease protein
MKYVSLILSLAVLLIAPFFGEITLNIQEILNPASSSSMLFWEIRSPRVIIAFCSGAILSLAGLVFQSIFRNPLTTPFTLGVASGATLGTALAIVFFGGLLFWQYALSFFGALLTVIVLFCSRVPLNRRRQVRFYWWGLRCLFSIRPPLWFFII